MSRSGHSCCPNILYLGSEDAETNSACRIDALTRIGCKVFALNPFILLGTTSKWQQFLDYRTGFVLRQKRLRRALADSLTKTDFKPEIVWVDSGELLGPRIVKWVSSYYNCPIILKCNDDPSGTRDGARFNSLVQSLPFYDLCVFSRLETSLEALALGAQRTVTVSSSYDEVKHAKAADRSTSYLSEGVSFIGTCIQGEERDQFLLQLASSGLPLAIRGNRWNRSRLWSHLQHFHKGGAVYGEEYARLLKASAINIGFLSHLNRDLVTRRAFEIAACGGLFCAERTSEHQLLFEDGVEAVFWDTVDECIAVCKKLLADGPRNRAIRTAGRNHILAAGFGNDDICHQILSLLP